MTGLDQVVDTHLGPMSQPRSSPWNTRLCSSRMSNHCCVHTVGNYEGGGLHLCLPNMRDGTTGPSESLSISRAIPRISPVTTGAGQWSMLVHMNLCFFYSRRFVLPPKCFSANKSSSLTTQYSRVAPTLLECCSTLFLVLSLLFLNGLIFSLSKWEYLNSKPNTFGLTPSYTDLKKMICSLAVYGKFLWKRRRLQYY